MEILNWELSVLSRAVAHPNLSGAASHVGISQPQLSRIIARLEEELGVVLLDREAKRKSAWTPQAFQLADIYNGLFRTWKSEVQSLQSSAEPQQVSIGSLEGLIPIASEFCQHLFEKSHAHVVEVDIEDLNTLEEYFFKGRYDFLFTSRPPGKKKFKFLKTVGFQSLDKIETSEATQVLSSFEFTTKLHYLRMKKDSKFVVSNSLQVRKHWLEKFGGSGTMPSPVFPKKPPGQQIVSVLLVGAERFNHEYWEKVSDFTSGA